jgi:hypothetical protein
MQGFFTKHTANKINYLSFQKENINLNDQEPEKYLLEASLLEIKLHLLI